MRKCLVILLILFAWISASARALDVTGTRTTTTLGISSRSVDIGTPVTMTAKVLLGATAVRHGSIVFCDASAARCQGLAVLGSAQLTSNGTATLKLTLGAGAYSVKAVFTGTPHSMTPASSSASAAQKFTVNGGSKTRPQEGSKRR
jgi:hypothetical protein